VSFAVNDIYGNVMDRVEGLTIDDEAINLECEPPMTFRDFRHSGGREGRIKFSRRAFRCYGLGSMVGNVFWESAEMEIAETRRLIAYLLERGWYVDEAPCDGPFADLFTDPTP